MSQSMSQQMNYGYAPQVAPVASVQQPVVEVPQAAHYEQEMHASAEQLAPNVDLNLNGSFPRQFPIQNENPNGDDHAEKPLPRDILLAKARQYRESQVARAQQPQPEQLSMNVENNESSLEMARRLANEIVKSPFDTKNLDVPAFLRRKQMQRLDEENENPTL
jgi:cell division protein FtsZ